MKWSLLLIVILSCLWSTTDAQQVTIYGQVYHRSDPNFKLLVVNKRTGLGDFGRPDGSFIINTNKQDTLLVGSLGYKTEAITATDSAEKSEYYVKVYLERLTFTLPSVTVMPQRELDSIQKDIQGLGYNQRDYMLSGIDPFQSPLTFLYQQVSRKERMKRNAYQVINEDRRRNLLKELFAKYVSYDIIDLDKSEFEDFIDFMNVSEAQMKAMSQYEFVMFTKNRYAAFRNTPPRLRQDIDVHD